MSRYRERTRHRAGGYTRGLSVKGGIIGAIMAHEIQNRPYILFISVLIMGLLLPLRSHGQEDWMRRGFQLLRTRQFEAAVTAFTRAIEAEPENAEAFNHRGVAWAYMGEIDRAISDYTRALEIRPELVGALNNRGSAFYQKALLNQAIADYSRAIEINPYLAEAYSNRGTAWAAKGDYFRAIRDYTQALENNPYFDAPYYNRGRALSAIGDYDKALEDMKRAVELNPQFHAAYDLMAKVYADCPDANIKDAEKAVAYAERAVKLERKPEYLGTLALAHAEAGNFDRAIESQQQALETLRKEGKTDSIEVYERGLEAILEKRRKAPVAVEDEQKEVEQKKPTPKKSMKKETMVSPTESAPVKRIFTIQAGAFLSKENADERNRYLLEKGYDTRVVHFSDPKGRTWHTVRVGRYESLQAARQEAAALSAKEKIQTSVRPGGSL